MPEGARFCAHCGAGAANAQPNIRSTLDAETRNLIAADKRWVTPPPSKTKPWTDDYTNLIGALWRHFDFGGK